MESKQHHPRRRRASSGFIQGGSPQTRNPGTLLVSAETLERETVMLHIAEAEYLGEYRVRFLFNDGREGVADLRQMIFDDPRSVFKPLRDPSIFREFFIEHGALCWPGDVDVAPEYIYFLAFRNDESLRSLFEEWGYINAEVAV